MVCVALVTATESASNGKSRSAEVTSAAEPGHASKRSFCIDVSISSGEASLTSKAATLEYDRSSSAAETTYRPAACGVNKP